MGCRRARGRGYPEGGGGDGPLPRPRDGFLLPQERRWGVVVPAQAGTQRGEVGPGLSRAPGMDSCFRRKDGGVSSCPRKRVPRGERRGRASPAPQGWIPAFAGMVAAPPPWLRATSPLPCRSGQEVAGCKGLPSTTGNDIIAPIRSWWKVGCDPLFFLGAGRRSRPDRSRGARQR